VSVVGVPGAGTTTLGARLAAAPGVRFVELGTLTLQPHWTELPEGELRRARVAPDPPRDVGRP
jgi:adenylate kinase family enzyme